MTTEKALLGMALFWDEQMSVNNTVACGTCHALETAGTDARPLGTHPGPDGVFGTADDMAGSPGVSLRNSTGDVVPSVYGLAPQVTPRRAPSLINVAYQDRLFYDGRAREGNFIDPVTGQVMATGPTAIENLILQPPLNPIEMGQPGRTWAQVVSKIASSQPLRLADHLPARLAMFIGSSSYPQLFARAFGTTDVTATRIVFAIATYLRTLVSDQTRFDYAMAGALVLTQQEQRGQQLFMQPVNPNGGFFGSSCVQCHGDLATSSHTTGPSARFTTMYGNSTTGNFHNTGIRPISEDGGEGANTGVASEMGRFKVPFLRNVALATSHGHNGKMGNLAQVVDFYSRGGDYHVNQAPEIQPRNLSAADKDALVAFLNTLTDPRVAAGVEPFDSPRLGTVSRTHVPTVFGEASAGQSQHLPVAVAAEPLYVGAQNATLAVQNVVAGSLVALLIDSSRNDAGTDVMGIRFYLGLQQPTIVALGVAQSSAIGGYFAQRLNVPNQAQLAGQTLTAQWLAQDASAVAGLTSSAAMDLHL